MQSKYYAFLLTNFHDKFLDIVSCVKGPEIGTENFNINKWSEGT
jgi:hypothetical protein